MAYKESNAAYDLSLFTEGTAAPKRKEASPAKQPKKQPQAKRRQEIVIISGELLDKVGKRRVNPIRVFFTTVIGAAVALLLVLNISGKITLMGLNQQLENAEASLENKKSAYTQAEMNVQSKYSTAVVEAYAKNKLGMKKSTAGAGECINLDEGDKAEIMNTENSNIFSKVIEAVKEILS